MVVLLLLLPMPWKRRRTTFSNEPFFIHFAHCCYSNADFRISKWLSIVGCAQDEETEKVDIDTDIRDNGNEWMNSYWRHLREKRASLNGNKTKICDWARAKARMCLWSKGWVRIVGMALANNSNICTFSVINELIFTLAIQNRFRPFGRLCVLFIHIEVHEGVKSIAKTFEMSAIINFTWTVFVCVIYNPH